MTRGYADPFLVTAILGHAIGTWRVLVSALDMEDSHSQGICYLFPPCATSCSRNEADEYT